MLVDDHAQVGVDGHQTKGHTLLEKILRIQLTKRAILAKLARVQVKQDVVNLRVWSEECGEDGMDATLVTGHGQQLVEGRIAKLLWRLLKEVRCLLRGGLLGRLKCVWK